MPYAIKKMPSGKYRVVNKDTGKTYSKHDQTREKAVAQLRAIEANTNGK